jgi:diguanylate cyclase (GGDEF)-like protein
MDATRTRILEWDAFLPVADLLVAQARRGQRPLSVLALALHERSAADATAQGARDVLDTELDEILAEILERIVRESDLAGRSGPARYLFVAADTPRLGALQFATRLHTLLGALLPEAVTTSRRISIGIATGPENGGSIEELVRNADTALTEAIAAGGDRARLYNWDGPEGYLHWEVEQDRLLARRRAALVYLSKAIRTGSIRSVGLQLEPDACPICQDAARESYPVNAVPPLPLAGCTSSRGCRCNYTSPALAKTLPMQPVPVGDARGLDLPRRFRDCALAGIDPRQRCHPRELAEYLEKFPLLSYEEPGIGAHEPVLLHRSGRVAWERPTALAQALGGLPVLLELPFPAWVRDLRDPPSLSGSVLYDEEPVGFYATSNTLVLSTASTRETIPLLHVTRVYYLKNAVACDLAGRDGRLVLRVQDPLIVSLYLARVLRAAIFQR